MARVLRLAALAVLLGIAAATCPADGETAPAPEPTTQLPEGRRPSWP
ncbi:hypothetical protein KY5_2574 [Streptomyces formicae]|uniref:Uncharacterized protein n=1 Tax=Streptomyces formicae TaxID=1616117 RepID=A0A291Q7L4_9ACTN|nr:hypothetical protein KY5_2574 [Streptomyces formicae]